MTKFSTWIGSVLIFLWASLSPTGSALADEAAKRGPIAGGAGYLAIGAVALDLGGLNGAMARSGYSAFSRFFSTLGGGGHAVIGRLVLGGEGHSLLAKSGGSSSTGASLSGGYGFVDIGWVVYAGRGFRVFPVLGIGAGSIRLDLADRSGAPFEDVIVDPKRGARLRTSGFLLNLALALEKWFGNSGRPGKSGFFIGARAGYVLAPARSGWELDRMEIEGGPKLNLGGPYLRLVVGAGSSGRNQ
jgi:hypothetical protein